MSKIGKTELSGTMSGGSMNRERIGNLAITGILGAIAYINVDGISHSRHASFY